MQYPSLTQFGQTNLANSFFVTSQPPLCGRCWCNLWLIISHIKGRYVEHFLWNCHHVNATRPRWWLVNIDWGNGLVPPGAIVDPDICHQMASLGQNQQRVLMHGHQGWNVRHGLCHIYMRYVYTYKLFIAFVFCCLFITVTWWYVWCIEWASGDQEEVQACLVTLWLFIISCYNLYKTTTNPHFHKYSMDFHV